MKSTVVVLAVAVLLPWGGLVSQQRPDEQRIAELIEQLKDERLGERSAKALLQIGKPAQAQMIQALETPAEARHAERILAVLGDMREDVDDVILEVIGLYEGSDIETRPALLRAVADLMLYSRRPNLVIPILDGSKDLVDGVPPDLGASIYNERLRLLYRVDLFAHSSGKERLLELLYSGRPYWQEVGAELLGEMKAQARSELEDLRLMLSQSTPFEVDGYTPEEFANLRFSSDGTVTAMPSATEIPYDFEVRTSIADAMEKIAPNDPAVITVVEAHRLLHDPNNYRRITAATRLGQHAIHSEEAPHAVSSLLEALGDSEDRVVEESITALGMIGPAASDAIPALDRLSEHEDPQIAERAKAALRQIRKRDHDVPGSPT